MFVDERRKINLIDLFLFLLTKITEKFPLFILSAATGVFTEIAVTLFSHSRFSVFNCIAGAFFGCFVFCIIFCLFYIFAENINTPEELEALTNSHIVTVVSVQPADKGILNKINALRIGTANLIPYDEQIKILKADIALSAKKICANNICVVSTCEEISNTDIQNAIKDAVSNIPADVIFIGNVSHSSFSIQQLSKADAVIFVEVIGKSPYAETAKTKSFCEKYNVPVISSVAVF